MGEGIKEAIERKGIRNSTMEEGEGMGRILSYINLMIVRIIYINQISLYSKYRYVK